MPVTVAAKVSGQDRVRLLLSSRSVKGRVRSKLHVGYSAPYAIYVHEDLQAKHPRGGQAKFLERPARQYQAEMDRIVAAKLTPGNRSIEDALLAAGRFLLSVSQPLVPVDTGRLKKSGFVKTA
jgi:hypothetical protein